MNTVQKVYEEHHAARRQQGFSIMKDMRGPLFSSLIGQGKRVLDVGCRDGALTSYFVQGNHVIGVDIDSISLERAKKDLDIDARLMDLYGDWSEIRGEKFDVIVASEVLEHLYFPEKILVRAKSFLKPGGSMIVSVPNAFSLKNRVRLFLGTKQGTPLADPTHINHFRIDEFRSLLARQFGKVEVIGLGRYSRLARLLPGLFGFDLVYIAHD